MGKAGDAKMQGRTREAGIGGFTKGKESMTKSELQARRRSQLG